MFKTKNQIIILLFILQLPIMCSKAQEIKVNTPVKDSISYIDGPYVFYENEKIKIVNVNRFDSITIDIKDKVDSLLVTVPNQKPDHFYVKLCSEIIVPETEYETPDKMLVVSDIEGNYFAFVNLLIANKVTDENLNWIYGKDHLVLTGDFVDRGEYVTQVLWLIYKLEQEAKKAGGHVHFILGNHEIMNLEGDFRYVQDKYWNLNKKLNIANANFYNSNNEIGKWMRSKNVIEKVGETLFVHAGISAKMLSKNINLNNINTIAQENYGTDLINDTLTIPNLLMGRYGVLWYRGLVTDYKYYPKATLNEIDNFLDFYSSNKIVVGHCIVDDISSDFGGKVIRVDIHHPTEEATKEKAKALLIENNILYKVNALGEKIELVEK